MRRIFFLAFLFLLFDYTSFGKIVYISSSTGNDANAGTDIAAPLQTVKKALEKGDSILLKRGDVFYEHLSIENKFLGAYGDGSSPILSGYKRIRKPEWRMISDNVWVLDLTTDNFSGYKTYGVSYANNIGCLHEYDKDVIHGHKVEHKDDLKQNWDIWQTDKSGSDTVQEKDYNQLYLFLDEDPNQLKLELSVGRIAMRVRNSTIDGLVIKGFGFGLSVKSNSVVRNCRIDAIGGMQQFGETRFVVYGNAIEMWVGNEPNENVLIDNNIISRVYDCAITIQGIPTSAINKPSNIIVKKNIIYDCCQAWESFMTWDKGPMEYENCYFVDNIVLNSGKTSGFGYKDSRVIYCHILSNNHTGSYGLVIKDNVFVGGNYYCTSKYGDGYKTNYFRNNKCYLEKGSFILSDFGGDDTYRLIGSPLKDGDVTANYRRLTGDYSTKFYVKSQKSIEKRIDKLKKRYLTQ